jgi:hypothetical protein
MANKYMRKRSTFLAIKKMQIKIALTFHLTPVTMDVIKKTKRQLMLAKMKDKVTLTHS